MQESKTPAMINRMQLQFKNSLHEIESTQLSPNLQAINQQL